MKRKSINRKALATMVSIQVGLIRGDYIRRLAFTLSHCDEAHCEGDSRCINANIDVTRLRNRGYTRYRNRSARLLLTRLLALSRGVRRAGKAKQTRRV